MRYDAVDFLNLQPIASPGEYTAKLSVDGIEQSSTFELLINPNESYTKAQIAAKKDFWMELYDVAKSSSAKIQKALAIQKEVMAEAESNTTAKAAADSLAKMTGGFANRKATRECAEKFR